MAKKAKLIVKDKDGNTLIIINSKNLRKILNKREQGDRVKIEIQENDFASQFVGDYIVKGLKDEPEEPEEPDDPEEREEREEPQQPQEGSIWNSTKSFADFEGQTFPLEQDAGESLVVYASNAGEQNSFHGSVKNQLLNIGGKNARVYFSHYKVKKPLENVGMIAYLSANEFVDNVSFAFGLHWGGEQRKITKQLFGKYGISFHFSENIAQSAVEYHHINESKGGEEEDHEMPQNQKLKFDAIIGYKLHCQTVNGKKQKAINAWVDFANNGQWTQVVKNRLWDSNDWDFPSHEDDGIDYIDENEVKDGPYMLPLFREWIRCNLGDEPEPEDIEKSRIQVKYVELLELKPLVI